MITIQSYEDEFFDESASIEENTRIIANTCSMFGENPEETLAKLGYFFLYHSPEQPYIDAIEESHIFDAISASIYQIPNSFPEFDLSQALFLISKLFTETSFIGKMFNTPEFLEICKSILEFDTTKYMERICEILTAFLRVTDGFVKIIESGFPEIVINLLDYNNHSVRMKSLFILKDICEYIDDSEFLMHLMEKVFNLAINADLIENRSGVCIAAMLCLKYICAKFPEVCQELAKPPFAIFMQISIFQRLPPSYGRFIEHLLDILTTIVKTVPTMIDFKDFDIVNALVEILRPQTGLNDNTGEAPAKVLELLLAFLNTRNEQFLDEIFSTDVIEIVLYHIHHGTFILKQSCIKFIHAVILYDPNEVLKYNIDLSLIFEDIIGYDNESVDYILKSINRLLQFNTELKPILQNCGLEDQLDEYIAQAKDQTLIELAESTIQNII